MSKKISAFRSIKVTCVSCQIKSLSLQSSIGLSTLTNQKRLRTKKGLPGGKIMQQRSEFFASLWSLMLLPVMFVTTNHGTRLQGGHAPAVLAILPAAAVCASAVQEVKITVVALTLLVLLIQLIEQDIQKLSTANYHACYLLSPPLVGRDKQTKDNIIQE